MTTMEKHGKLVVVEGPDKPRNTLHARTLVDRLLEQDIASRFVHEPCELPSSGFSQNAEADLQTLNGCRSRIFKDEINQGLEAGEIVISDGNWMSSIVRQGIVQNMGASAVREISRLCLPTDYLNQHFTVLLSGGARVDEQLIRAYDTIGSFDVPKIRGPGLNFSYINPRDDYEEANERILDKLRHAKII